MAIGERIRFIRNLRGMTQKYLGTLVGFPEKTADIRMAQYEAGTRTPKESLTKALASALEVSPLALNTPDIDTYLGLMHTLFALEDRYGLTIEKRDGETLLRFDPRKGSDAFNISQMVNAWASVAEKYSAGYASDKRNNTSWTFWSKDFDGMACKTMLRQLISKWGIMSVEMQKALENDSAVISENGNIEFIDSTSEPTAVPVVDTGEVVDVTEIEQEAPDEFASLMEG